MSQAGKRDQTSEAQRLGLALKRLRIRHDLSQKAAAELVDVTQQSWQRWERAENDALLKVDLQRRLAIAIGASHEEFMMELARVNQGEPAAPLPPAGFGDRPGRKFEFPLDGRARASADGMQIYDSGDAEVFDMSAVLDMGTRFLRLAGESMVPYAEPGGFVSYNIFRAPRRGQGCVIRKKDGTFFVKRYEGTDGPTLKVTEFKPITYEGRPGYIESPMEFDLREVEGVYPIGVRGD